MKNTKTKTQTALGGRPANNPGFTWVGRALRMKRIELGMSAVDLGIKIGVSRSAINQWEADTYSPTWDNVTALARALKCKRTYFSKLPELPRG